MLIFHLLFIQLIKNLYSIFTSLQLSIPPVKKKIKIEQKKKVSFWYYWKGLQIQIFQFVSTVLLKKSSERGIVFAICNGFFWMYAYNVAKKTFCQTYVFFSKFFFCLFDVDFMFTDKAKICVEQSYFLIVSLQKVGFFFYVYEQFLFFFYGHGLWTFWDQLMHLVRPKSFTWTFFGLIVRLHKSCLILYCFLLLLISLLLCVYL